ncbi:alkylglycerol monooxygenase isoform X3 [Stegostoma tigrinum]|uniref:alkylglycerol monooxygenase isoform X3 n=1 Tax=Stegostoma tigrinum TaxID=3053191 RepID=UPI0028708425|nr:alkylglycerol monooxygenase isoform X3 [Stegostoma tigrinum]
MVLHLQSNLTLSQGVRLMFYALTPSETTFREVDQVYDYVQQATPYFVGLMIIELVVTWFQKGKTVFRINDALTSISAGILSRTPELLGRGIELTGYIYIWRNFRLFELPWNSAWTWWLALLGVDFAYYWLHRMSHEVNMLWAAHQVHHSSEDYNLSTALRQSVLQKYFSWVFNLPMALFIPPSVFAVHLQFNLLYQFWIHTEDGTITASTRIMLELLSFGTGFSCHHLLYILKTFWATPGICNKISVLFKGPGWQPGKPRLGCLEDIPAISGNEIPHNPHIPVWLQLYAVLHFILILGIYLHIFAHKSVLSEFTILLGIGYIILTLSSIGLMMENRSEVAILEIVRCCIFLFLELGSLTGPLKLVTKDNVYVNAKRSSELSLLSTSIQ